MNLYELFIGAILTDQVNPDQASVDVVEEIPELEAVAVRMNLTLYQRTSEDGPLPTLHMRSIHVKVVAKTCSICVVQAAKEC